MWGRTDLERFAHGLRTMRNFFPTRQGEAVSRPGTKYVGQPIPLLGTGQYRLVPFVYSDDLSYVIVLSSNKAQFVSNGTMVGAGNTFVRFRGLTVPFTVGAFWSTPSGAQGTIIAVVMDGPGTGTVELNVADFDPGGFGHVLDGERCNDTAGGAADHVVGTNYQAPYTIDAFADTVLAELKWVQSGDRIIFSHPLLGAPIVLLRVAHASWVFPVSTFSRKIGFSYTGPAVGAFIKAPLPTPTVAEPAREWSWAVTLVYRDAGTGFNSETGALVINETATALPNIGAAAAPATVAVYQDLPVTVFVPMTGIVSGLNGVPVAVRIYRGRGTTFGWVGEVEWGQETFTDTGKEPDYLQAPPQGKNPFEVYNSSNLLVRTEKPRCLSFFQERLVYGGTAERGSFIFASATGDYFNFDDRIVPIADEALVFELASRKREQMRALLSLNKLLAFSNSSVWSISGQDTSPLTFDSVDARVIEEIGITARLPPLSVDGCALYGRAKGGGVRALVPARTASGFQGIDITLEAQHLFYRYPLAGAFAYPDSVPVASIVDWTYAEDPYGLIWACMSDGALISLTFSLDSKQWAWARHDTNGDQVLAVCAVPEGSEDGVYLLVSRGGSQPFIERLFSRAASRPICLDTAVQVVINSWDGEFPSTELYGLEILEGKSVWAVPSGTRNSPSGPYPVVDGHITIDQYNAPELGPAIIWVGTTFSADLETLDVASSSVRGKQKTVSKVAFEVIQTTAVKVGQDFEHLEEGIFRDVADDFDAMQPQSDLFQVFVEGKWDKAGRAVLRQDLPYPVTVVGVTREVVVGDD